MTVNANNEYDCNICGKGSRVYGLVVPFPGAEWLVVDCDCADIRIYEECHGNIQDLVLQGNVE